jgi:hypothetical protein
VTEDEISELWNEWYAEKCRDLPVLKQPDYPTEFFRWLAPRLGDVRPDAVRVTSRPGGYSVQEMRDAVEEAASGQRGEQ